MKGERTIGDFQRIVPRQPADVTVTTDGDGSELNWQEADRLARFVGEYLNHCGSAPLHPNQLASIGYATNELAENAIKYSADQQFELSGWNLADALVLVLTNTLDARQAESLIEAAQSISLNDPHELFIQRVEDNADGPDTGSGLGLLTLIVDHGAQLGWRLAAAENGYVQLHTVVRLPTTHEE